MDNTVDIKLLDCTRSDCHDTSHELHSVSNHWQLDLVISRLLVLTTITGPLWGEFTGDRWFPSQGASYAVPCHGVTEVPTYIVRDIFSIIIHYYAPSEKELLPLRPRLRFNIKMPSFQYRKSHCGDKTVVRSSYLHNGISYTGKMSSLYWIGALVGSNAWNCPDLSSHRGTVRL